MERSIDIVNNSEHLNEWVLKSINLFKDTNYLDRTFALVARNHSCKVVCFRFS
jgi:hypothetical protein